MNKEIINKLQHWLDLLNTDGCNSKAIVKNEIQETLNHLTKPDKKYRLEFKSPLLLKHKHKIHYTNRLYLYLNEIKGRFSWYPENNFPLEIYNNETDHLIVKLNNIEEFRKFLKGFEEKL